MRYTIEGKKEKKKNSRWLNNPHTQLAWCLADPAAWKMKEPQPAIPSWNDFGIILVLMLPVNSLKKIDENHLFEMVLIFQSSRFTCYTSLWPNPFVCFSYLARHTIHIYSLSFLFFLFLFDKHF